MKRQILSILLACVLPAILLAGCTDRRSWETNDQEADSLLRVFMAWQALDEPIEVTEPERFTGFARDGFTVVEWGGCEVS